MPSGIYKRIKQVWNKGIKNPGVGGRPKGGTAWNKDTKGICKPNSGSFKKSHKLNIGKHSNNEFKKGHKINNGENHWSWKGGITPKNKLIRHSIEYELWRNAVFARDGYTCQKTGIKGEKLVSHHIQNFSQFPELRFAIDNGITLSKESHKQFHKKYGFTKNTKEQLLEFLNN